MWQTTVSFLFVQLTGGQRCTNLHFVVQAVIMIELLNINLKNLLFFFLNIQLTGLFQFTVRLLTETEARFTSVERINHYIKV